MKARGSQRTGTRTNQAGPEGRWRVSDSFPRVALAGPGRELGSRCGHPSGNACPAPVLTQRLWAFRPGPSPRGEVDTELPGAQVESEEPLASHSLGETHGWLLPQEAGAEQALGQ